jgi:hypothetical protein
LSNGNDEKMDSGEPMRKTTFVSLQLVMWILIWFLVLGTGLAYMLMREGEAIREALYGLELTSPDAIMGLLRDRGLAFAKLAGACLAGSALLLWLSLQYSVNRILRKCETEIGALAEQSQTEKQPASGVKPEPLKDSSRDDEQRALQLLSLLQREGRFMDFLGENLQAYDDGQIGMAVRSIHENCKKVLHRYLALEAVINVNEGDEVTIPEGFNPNEIKLTGNVSGHPPFKGTLHHRGWRAARFDLPTLSGSQDPRLISPAEVEIE